MKCKIYIPRKFDLQIRIFETKFMWFTYIFYTTVQETVSSFILLGRQTVNREYASEILYRH